MGGKTHDRRVPEALRRAMRDGWESASLSLEPVTGYTAQRRDALRDALAGETVHVGCGTAAVRANDTTFRLRGDSDFLYLVGMPVEDAVLVVAPHGDTLYVPQSAGPGTDDFWLDAARGQLWVGPQPRPAELAAALRRGVSVLGK
jgi:Xaa-Pro aminopeptidase